MRRRPPEPVDCKGITIRIGDNVHTHTRGNPEREVIGLSATRVHVRNPKAPCQTSSHPAKTVEINLGKRRHISV